jgi:glycosyltransferase involved in cell wall biosynthesis
MLTLESALKKFPQVMFYWVGDGPYRNYVLSKLEKYDNFKWLGSLQYPDKVREYLSEIDVYLLLSGIDMSPLTLLEAQLMEKPVIATNVGGIPELMTENKTGFLINRGDHSALIDKISIFLSDENKCKSIGKTGRDFVKDNFSWEKVAKDFVTTLKERSLI